MARAAGQARLGYTSQVTPSFSQLNPLPPPLPPPLPLPLPLQLPGPCFNVFERDRTPARTHFCATCLLPHLGLQLTPDAVYPSPLDAMENSAILAILYLEGALAPDCPLVHFAPAGAMAQVPHAFVTEAELRMDARLQQGGALQQQPVGLQQGEAARRGGDLKRPQQHHQQQQMAAGGDVPGLHPHPQQQQQQQPGGPLGLAGERPLKRLRPDKQPLTIGQALGQIGPGKNPLMVRLGGALSACSVSLPGWLPGRPVLPPLPSLAAPALAADSLNLQCTQKAVPAPTLAPPLPAAGAEGVV